MFLSGLFRLSLSSLFCLSFAVSVSAEPTRECVARESGSTGSWWYEQQPIMGTQVQVELWHANQATACGLIAQVMAEMHRINQAMSPYIESSLLSRMNAGAAHQPVVVGKELFDLIALSLDWSERTQGAFDVTYASVGRYYDYRNNKKPASDEIADNIEGIDYRHISLNRADFSVKYLHDAVYVDLGGIAKGYAVDRGAQILRQAGITQAMVSAGGDSRIIGDRLGEPWVVGVRHPRKAGENVAVLPLIDASVSTSGDYERYFERDGVRYHHIIDPVTGDSAREVTSVTIIGADATTTDALSTSVFVMGIKRGLSLINGMTNIDAVIVGSDGRMYLSRSLLELSSAH